MSAWSRSPVHSTKSGRTKGINTMEENKGAELFAKKLKQILRLASLTAFKPGSGSGGSSCGRIPDETHRRGPQERVLPPVQPCHIRRRLARECLANCWSLCGRAMRGVPRGYSSQPHWRSRRQHLAFVRSAVRIRRRCRPHCKNALPTITWLFNSTTGLSGLRRGFAACGVLNCCARWPQTRRRV